MESKTAFLDTNVLIAFVFIINSLHLKSKKVFEVYDELFLSKFVENEFEWRYFEKFDNLKDFFNDLRDYLENPEYDFYSTKILEDFAQNNYTGKLLNDAKSSIKPFWNQYVGMESIVSFQNLKCPIRNCLSDLKIKT